MFTLHERLKKDLIEVRDLSLSKLLLYPDTENPWIVLVPKVEGIKEFHNLDKENQIILLEEINMLSKKMEAKFKPDKINIGSLGNMVPQLHIHIICRFEQDRSWPGAIWGSEAKLKTYQIAELKKFFS